MEVDTLSRMQMSGFTLSPQLSLDCTSCFQLHLLCSVNVVHSVLNGEY